MKFLFDKADKLPPKADKLSLLRSLIGGTLGILILEVLTQFTTLKFIMAPFGATCVLLFAVSNSPLSQPRNVIFGHLISAFVGLCFLKFLGASTITIALAVGIAILLMQFTKCIHPPAGANPLVVLLGGTQNQVGWDFLIFPVLIGSICLVLTALIVNNVKTPKSWPDYWFAIFKSYSNSSNEGK